MNCNKIESAYLAHMCYQSLLDERSIKILSKLMLGNYTCYKLSQGSQEVET